MAVYTHVGEDELKVFLGDYAIGEAVSFTGITHGVENSNYHLTTTSGEYILTLYEKRVAKEDLPFFIGLMQHMAGAGIVCPMPIADKAGVILKRLKGREAVIISFLEGIWSQTPTAERCFAGGEVLGRMHLAGASYPNERANALNTEAWRPLLESSVKSGEADTLIPNVREKASLMLDEILAAWRSDLPCGIIHADLFPDNVLFVGDKVTGVIDFYFACNDIFAYDLAIMLNAWCFDANGEFNLNKAKQLMAGYQSVRKLSKEELEAIPILLRGAAMRFFLTRLYDWINTPKDAQVQRLDPLVYWQRLNFHQQKTTLKAYGL